MNSSVGNDLPILVCTNTWRDYALTRRDPIFDDETARRFLKVLLPAFARAMTESRGTFQTAVGVMQFPGDMRRIVAFRVFDVGEFHGRPNTLGIVGVAAPRSADRDWPLSAILSRLSPPRPNTEGYSLAELSTEEMTPSADPPFAQLDEWERGGEELSPSGAICFCLPEMCTPTIRWPADDGGETARTNSHRRGPLTARRFLVGIVAVAILIGIAAWFGFDFGKPTPSGTTQPGTTHAPTPSLEDSRGRVAKLLLESHCVTEFEAKTFATQRLLALAPPAAQRARQNIEQLGDALDSMTKDRPAEISAILARHLERWETPPEPLDSTSGNVAMDELERSLQFLESYRGLFADVQEAAQRPTAPNIDRLRVGVRNTLALPRP